MSDGVRVELLGRVRAFRGEVEADIGSGHRRAVLAVLALSPGRAVSRAELIDAVWGEHPPASASGSIYTYVSSLRHALDPDRRGRSDRSGTVSSDGSGYALRVPPEAVDVHLFDAHRERAHALRAEGDLVGALAELDAALGLWRGEPLSGLPGPFAERHRARLTELRLATVERRAEIVLASGRHRELVAKLTDLVRDNPLRETPRALLMTALYLDNRAAEALEVYADARRALIERSGTEPSATLRGVRDKIADAAKPPATIAADTFATPAPPDVLVGRDSESAWLRGLLGGLRDGGGRAVLVEGEPGIGKTALVASALAAPPPDVCVYWSAGDELEWRYPLRLLADCLGFPTGDAAHDTAEEVAPDRVLEWLRDTCAQRPVVIVVDDLQWGDDTTLTVWPRLRQATAELPLLLIGVLRPVPLRERLDRLRATHDAAEVLRLGPLSEEAVDELVTDVAGGAPSRALREQAVQAAGNPFYLRTLLDTLLTGGLVTAEAGTADLEGSAPATLPAALSSTVLGRLGFLSQRSKEFLRWAALLGREFSLDDAVAALDQPAEELDDPLSEARAAGVLVEARGALSFRHPLVRRVLYQRTPGAVRVAVHRQLAASFAESGAPVDRVAAQLAAGAPIEPWGVDWLAEHVDALGTAAPSLAAALFQHVLEHASPGPEHRAVLTDALARLRLLSRAGADLLSLATGEDAQ